MLIWCQFHQHFTRSFYTRSAKKCQKDSQVNQLFVLLGSVSVKAAHKDVDAIDPCCQFHQPFGSKRK